MAKANIGQQNVFKVEEPHRPPVVHSSVNGIAYCRLNTIYKLLVKFIGHQYKADVCVIHPNRAERDPVFFRYSCFVLSTPSTSQEVSRTAVSSPQKDAEHHHTQKNRSGVPQRAHKRAQGADLYSKLSQSQSYLESAGFVRTSLIY